MIELELHQHALEYELHVELEQERPTGRLPHYLVVPHILPRRKLRRGCQELQQYARRVLLHERHGQIIVDLNIQQSRLELLLVNSGRSIAC